MRTQVPWALSLLMLFVASNYGRMWNAMVVHWPDRIKAKGDTRSQRHHVIDVAPEGMDILLNHV